MTPVPSSKASTAWGPPLHLAEAVSTRGSERDYADRLPTAADVFSVIEVAHSSIGRDQEDKLPIYAAAGIGQYVIINLNNNTVEIFEEPDVMTEQYRRRRPSSGAGAFA